MADPVSASVAALSIASTAAGTIMQSNAQRAAGSAAQTEANFEAQQTRVQAGQQQASAQRAEIEQERQKKLVLGKAQAAAAANGLDPSSASVIDIMGSLDDEGTYRQKTALYEGDAKAQDMNFNADVTQWQAGNAKRAADQRAQGTILSGVGSLAGQGSSLYAKYATPGFSSTSNSVGLSSASMDLANQGALW